MREQFLEYAGCSSAEFVISGRPGVNFLLACLSYLMWVEDVQGGLDLTADRQTAVIELERLFRESGRDLASCKRAMAAKLQSGEPSATELLQLGEVTCAFQLALAHIDSESGRRVRKALLEDPLYAHSPHVDDDRIELAWTDPRSLGERVAENVRDHVILCSACGEAYDQRVRQS
jgi:hypothetical protein